VHYLVYFLGPLLLKITGRKILLQPAVIFRIGFIAFFAAWVINQTIASVSLRALGLTERSFLYTLIVALAAGIFEELARYVAFRQCRSFAGNYNRNSGLMYALGHNGAETVIVGATLGLISAVVAYKPDAIADPALLKQCRETAALGSGVQLYNAFERLLVGLLVHACFSAVVMLAFVRRQQRFLFVAIGWHFLHDLIGLNLHRLSGHWLVSKGWVAIIVVLYTYIFVRLYRAMPPPSHGSPVERATPPMILPVLGRTSVPPVRSTMPP